MPHRVNYDVVDPLIKAYREADPKISTSELARRLRAKQVKVGKDSILKRLILMGFEVRATPPFPARDAELLELRKLGKSRASIAKTMGVTVKQVARRLGELGPGEAPVAGMAKKRPPRPKPQELPEDTYGGLPNGWEGRDYLRSNSEIPAHMRTLPILPSISGTEFGNAFYYKDQRRAAPVAVASGGDESGESSGSDSSGPG